ncbi:cytochrome P450 2C8-like isoform X1 [Ostrea edulis]|uniref:cytochrome P450 2C8-like isoform X1 n=1 Tax=Ostrea edulis TaxID=37623 RepID=UPI0024AFF547|nr:cytochrome P450 2C8-like isoform X1 [Ostrea edulis]
MWVTIAIALLFVSLIWSLTGRRKGLPPGPTCYPIIGNVGLFKPSEAVQGHRRLRKIYGDFYSMMIFHKPMIIVHGYQNIRELLGKHGDMFSERPKGFASEVITKGKGLIWSSGPLWKEQRTFALTTMRKFGFGRRCMESQIIEEVDCLMNELKKYKNKAFDIQTPLNTSVSNVICSLLYGKRFDYDDYKFKRLISILNKLFSTGNASSPANIFPSLRHIPCFSLDSVIENVRSLKGFVKEMIEEHKRNFDEDNINDYIDTYLLEQKQRSNEVDTTFTDEQLNYSVQDFFAAGTETTSTTLRWALLYLIHHQDWQKGLQNDIDDVIGQGQPKMEHKDKLPRVEAFILEVQRLGNLVPINLPHAPKEDFTYNGHLFPKGAIVFCVLDSVMMDPDIFPEPSEFKPERFLDPSGKCSGEQKDSMVPFATGRRACLGESLAKMELFLFLTRFLQTFDVKPENPNCLPSLDSTLGITNMPLPFNVVLNKR